MSTQKAEAQNKIPYKIAVYELNRDGAGWEKGHYTYKIRNLFSLVDDTWECVTDNTPIQYYLVFKGEKIGDTKGVCCEQKPGYWYQEYDTIKNSGRFLKARPWLSLAENYFAKPFKNSDVDLVKKAVLLSNNPSFKQQTKLKSYFSTEAEKFVLRDSVKAYLKTLYISNEACIEKSEIDSVINRIINPVHEVFIDSANSFIDNQNNKLINLLVPVHFLYSWLYPFNDGCWTEDSRQYFKILCYINNSGKISFVGDNLQYLDHGDFDNDGKDEFLFWTSRHNHDGYVMYYDDFKKMVKLTWNYH